MIEEEDTDCSEDFEYGCDDCPDYGCTYRDTSWIDPND